LQFENPDTAPFYQFLIGNVKLLKAFFF